MPVKRNKSIRNFIKILFILYLGVLLLILVFKFPTRIAMDTIQQWFQGEKIRHGQIQWIPFKTITFYAGQVHALNDWFFKNLCCNIVIFIPYGFLLPLCLKQDGKKFLTTFVSGILLILGIEFLQFLFGIGLCDIDDFILNTISILIGYGCYKLLRNIKTRISIKDTV